jgi:hypothetical protein
MPSMAIDTEWFYPQAYPPEVRQYLATSWSFDVRPKTAATIIEDTQEFLRHAYGDLPRVGLDIKIAAGLQEMFKELTFMDPHTNVPKHPYSESEAVKTSYMVLAYVMSTLIWTNGGHKPLRDYKEVTYPGVIASAYVYRMTTYYIDLSNALGLLGPNVAQPYIRGGGHTMSTMTDELLNHGTPLEHCSKQEYPNCSMSALTAVPIITYILRLAAEYALGKKTDLTNCSDALYAALQDAALNVKGLDDTIATANIMLQVPEQTNPNAQRITDARCQYFLGLIQKKISPRDSSAAIPGGAPGLEPFTDAS